MLDCLAECDSERSLNRLCNGQIELRWAGVTLFLRVADLLVLHEALRSWLDDLDRAWSSAYASMTNPIGFKRNDGVCRLVRFSTAPRFSSFQP